MAFYIYEQPAISMEHFHPGFYQPLRSMSRPRHWNLLEKLFDDEEKACQSTVSTLLQLRGSNFQNGFLGGVQFKFFKNLTNFYPFLT